MSALRTRMLDDMRVRGYSPRTQESYVDAVAKLARYYHRSPDTLSQQEVQAYLLYLVQDKHAAWNTCNIIVHGLKFFYHVTLKRRKADFILPLGKKPAKLPEVLSREEVERLLRLTANPKHRAILTTAYAAGLRVSEVCHLKVGDIDSGRMLIRVEQGKGRKDRYVPLSSRLLTELRAYWRQYRPGGWLFPGSDARKPLTASSIERIYQQAKARAGISKSGGPHALRHSYATHLLEAGVETPFIQHALGHSSLSTTARYLHLADLNVHAVRSPLDLLPSGA